MQTQASINLMQNTNYAHWRTIQYAGTFKDELMVQGSK